MKSIYSLIAVLILNSFSCNEKKALQETNTKHVKSSLVSQDSSETFTYYDTIETNNLKTLKSVYDSQSKIGLNKSIKFYEKDSITDFIYLRDLFPIWESDSIEFYGKHNREDIDFNNFPANSLLIICWNNRRLSRNQINLLEDEWHNKEEALGTVFKQGGIAFELNHQLCIYTAEACNGDYSTIERIDSILKSRLQKAYRYDRILTTCKSEPFQRRVN